VSATSRIAAPIRSGRACHHGVRSWRDHAGLARSWQVHAGKYLILLARTVTLRLPKSLISHRNLALPRLGSRVRVSFPAPIIQRLTYIRSRPYGIRTETSASYIRTKRHTDLGPDFEVSLELN
jgi:hypothetical protein